VKLSKRIFKSDGFRAVACWLASGLIRVVHLTNRWQVIGGDIPQKFWAEKKTFILCFWHGRIMMAPYCWDKNAPINMLISDHQDGQLIARTVSHFGIKTVVGSTSKGGVKAVREMVKWIKGGEYVGITPDGPRGPRMRSSEGAVVVARLSGVPLIPVSFSTSRGKNLRSWDRFLVAKPFGRGVFVWGEPIYVGRDNVDQARKDLEDSLNRLTMEADQHAGRSPVEPAPLEMTGG